GVVDGARKHADRHSGRAADAGGIARARIPSPRAGADSPFELDYVAALKVAAVDGESVGEPIVRHRGGADAAHRRHRHGDVVLDRPTGGQSVTVDLPPGKPIRARRTSDDIT